MTVTVDKNKALDLLTQALEVKGAAHTQSACYYITRDDYYVPGAEAQWSAKTDDEPKPGCLVGTALFLLDKEALIKTVVEGGVNGDLIGSDRVTEGLRANGIDLTDEALDVFQIAQALQDGRHPRVFGNRTWGESVMVARGDLSVDDLPTDPI